MIQLYCCPIIIEPVNGKRVILSRSKPCSWRCLKHKLLPVTERDQGRDEGKGWQQTFDANFCKVQSEQGGEELKRGAIMVVVIAAVEKT